MNISPEALLAFTHAAHCGSFSAAARRLGKRQSTVSETVARLELDLGVELFVRGARQLQLTEAGSSLLSRAEAVLEASDRLVRHAVQLAQGHEASLTLAFSDSYQSHQYEACFAELDRRFPELNFECVIAEHADILDLLDQGRVQLGLTAAQASYPAHLAHRPLPGFGEFALFAARQHPLANLTVVRHEDLAEHRALRLSSVSRNALPDDLLPNTSGRCWSAPDYLMLLEMAELGYGWTALPRHLVQNYGRQRLVELQLPGWPRRVQVDALWSRQRPLGPIAAWLLEHLSEHGSRPAWT
ncbi:LysR family transcriptional regulator [Pseudomonas sp. NCCP-436]|uniref:LysR family transcriptional regulator n=1 Tax=Pseudomonas sp. NCCP-436 TaxID=2842481 RepID=UPI001C80FDD0|nr:LysR family transcriptional regulator [Pseudomonas sp. NCCP-436]GIZ13650.1 LysR family transcriptional regulator [Pseudomonas sp. NCCP-436]